MSQTNTQPAVDGRAPVFDDRTIDPVAVLEYGGTPQILDHLNEEHTRDNIQGECS